MNSFISGRRSIRKYKSTPVKRDLIEAVLEAGLLAPSSKTGSHGSLLWFPVRQSVICSMPCAAG